jgi:hypothetical protein
VQVVSAYQCPYCLQCYNAEASAELCTRACHGERSAKARARSIKRKLDKISNEPRLTATSILHFRDLLVAAAEQHLGYVVEFPKFAVRWDDRVSCSHHAPIGQKTNWGGYEAYPSNYPGWNIGIDCKLTWSKNVKRSVSELSQGPLFGEEIFFYRGSHDTYPKFVGLHSGGGSSHGSEHKGPKTFNAYSYAFLLDFPKIKQLMNDDIERYCLICGPKDYVLEQDLCKECLK